MQNLLVYALVALSAGYVALRFMPATMRRTLLQTLAQSSARLGLSSLSGALLRAALPAGGGCSAGCGSCHSAQRAVADPTRGATATGSPAGNPAPGRFIPIRAARTNKSP